MSSESARDPRRVLVQDKYFSLRPKPLERWLWRHGIAHAAERVFWLHWEEGMRRGDWCSEMSLKHVARECCIDTSTVTRAYQVLKALGVLRREDPGRDPQNPFLQAIAVTEVLLPRGLLQELGAAPNRPARRAQTPATAATVEQGREATLPAQAVAGTSDPLPPRTAAAPPKLDRARAAALMARLSPAERAAFFVASRDRSTRIDFDADTCLTGEEQGEVRALLARLCSDAPQLQAQPVHVRRAPAYAPARRISPLDAARLRKSVTALAGGISGPELFRQVLWSVEEGALRRFEPRLAANIALKKIREGAWSRPHRMPPNWLRPAAPEPCSAA